MFLEVLIMSGGRLGTVLALMQTLLICGEQRDVPKIKALSQCFYIQTFIFGLFGHYQNRDSWDSICLGGSRSRATAFLHWMEPVEVVWVSGQDVLLYRCLLDTFQGWCLRHVPLGGDLRANLGPSQEIIFSCTKGGRFGDEGWWACA